MGPDRISELSPRQLECLRLAAQHNTTDMIAFKLGISPKTVDAHIAGALTKLGVSSRRIAAQQVIEHDRLCEGKVIREVSLVDPPPLEPPTSTAEPEWSSRLRDVAAERSGDPLATWITTGTPKSKGHANDLTALQRLALIAAIVALIAIILIAVRPLADGYRALANSIEPFH